MAFNPESNGSQTNTSIPNYTSSASKLTPSPVQQIDYSNLTRAFSTVLGSLTSSGSSQDQSGSVQSSQNKVQQQASLDPASSIGGYRSVLAPGNTAPTAYEVARQKYFENGLRGTTDPQGNTERGNSFSELDSSSSPNGYKGISEYIITNTMKDFGLTREQAIGFAANFAHESNQFQTMQEVNPTSGRGGLGYAQWTGPRRVEFETYLKENGLKADSPEANYGFMKYELQNNESKVLEKLKSASTAEEATRIVEKYYERPGVPHTENRLKYANDLNNTALNAAGSATPDNSGEQVIHYDDGSEQFTGWNDSYAGMSKENYDLNKLSGGRQSKNVVDMRPGKASIAQKAGQLLDAGTANVVNAFRGTQEISGSSKLTASMDAFGNKIKEQE